MENPSGTRTSREFHLAARPVGEPREADFELAEVRLASPADGEVLVRNRFLSVDPYMRGRMTDAPSYAKPYAIGRPMEGAAVGQVLHSASVDLQAGDWVTSLLGWREAFVASSEQVRKLDPARFPVTAAIGVLGMTGLTAYVGIKDIADPQPDETVFVSAAAGAVGSTAGQLAKLRGCRVVGSAGSSAKLQYVCEELGFDAAFNYRETPPATALAELCPDGIDVYFDNVGGDQLDAALANMRDFGRIVMCGAIAQYNVTEPPPGPRNLVNCVTRRLAMRGFIVSDHISRLGEFRAEVAPFLASGGIRHRETIVDGIENAPAAFIGVLKGDNIGKMLVHLARDDG